MSNRAYLIRSNDSVFPARSSSKFHANDDILLQAPSHIPLLWFFLFGVEDVRVRAIYERKHLVFKTKVGESLSLVSPYKSAIERLAESRNFVNSIFVKNGGLDHHIDILLRHLEKHSGQFLHLDADEVIDLDPSYQQGVRNILGQVEERDPSVESLLVEYSTVMPERSFITLEDASSGEYEQEDMWNYFRILGDSFWGSVKAEWA